MGNEQTLTSLPLELNGKLVNTIQVPFTPDELDQIKQMRELKETWRSEAMRGSGWTRELYTHLDIPWGYSLTEREKAFEKMKKSLGLIQKALEKESDSKEVASLAEDLRQLQSGFRKFVPEEVS